MDKPSPDKRLNKLASQIPDDQDVWDSINQLMDDTSAGRDHVIATVAGSNVDKALEVAIKAKMVPLTADELNQLFSFEKKGPLADFRSKIRIAKGLDVFGPDTTQDLDRVR